MHSAVNSAVRSVCALPDAKHHATDALGHHFDHIDRVSDRIALFPCVRADQRCRHGPYKSILPP